MNSYRIKLRIVIHNLKHYDGHLICEAIPKHGPSKITCIAQSVEKYISFTLDNLQFLDSYQHLGASLDKLVNNLRQKGPEHFKVSSAIV